MIYINYYYYYLSSPFNPVRSKGEKMKKLFERKNKQAKKKEKKHTNIY